MAANEDLLTEMFPQPSALYRSETIDFFPSPSPPALFRAPSSPMGCEVNEEETSKCVLCKFEAATYNFLGQKKPLYCEWCAKLCAEGRWDKTLDDHISGERCQSDSCDGYAVYFPVHHSVKESPLPINVYCYFHRYGLERDEPKDDDEELKKCYPIDTNKPDSEEKKPKCRGRRCEKLPTHNYVENAKPACCARHALFGMVVKRD
jgi:hypothetical protein